MSTAERGSAVSGAMQPLLYMVTTTSVPYMYHLPVILGLPSGVPYWFRYLSQYLHPDLLSRSDTNLPRRGLLYLRDNRSTRKLCYPVRWFEVLWFERSHSVCFLNLLMARRATYEVAPPPSGEDLAVPEGLHERSWRLLVEHIRDDGVPARPAPRMLSAPLASEPPILPWEELKPRGENQALLWVADAVFTPDRRKGGANDERDEWRSLLPAFAGIENVRKTPFFFLHPPTASTDQTPLRPLAIQSGHRFSGRYSHGFAVRPSRTYRLRIDEITPNAFCEDVPTAAPFTLTIASSDAAIRPTVKDVQIDGPYGYYELSFALDPARVGTYTILRVSTEGLALPAGEAATADGAAGIAKQALPFMEVPLIIRRRWLHDAMWGAAFTAFILAFVTADQWMPACGIVPASTVGAIAKAFLFAMALFAAKNAGLDEFAGNLEKKL